MFLRGHIYMRRNVAVAMSYDNIAQHYGNVMMMVTNCDSNATVQ